MTNWRYAMTDHSFKIATDNDGQNNNQFSQ